MISSVLVAAVVILVLSIRIVNEYDRLVVFFLGRLRGVRGPGPVIVIPGLMTAQKVSLRILVHDVPPQDIITKDNISIKVNAVVYFRVLDPSKAIVQVQDFFYATSQLAQTTLRSVLGKMDLDDLLSNRDKINAELQQILDTHTEPWGIKVANVEVKNVDLPQDMLRAIARQAEAERERRAKVIHAAGELQAAEKLAQAAAILSTNPASIQLRYLQTLSEIASEKNSTTLFPIPIDLISMFLKDKVAK